MVIFLVLGMIGLCVSVSVLLVFDSDDDEFLIAKRFTKWLSSMVVVSALGVVFIPSTKEMYAIYGLGGTIDYLKENKTAKQLPDKVINALDKWIDGLNEEKEK